MMTKGQVLFLFAFGFFAINTGLWVLTELWRVEFVDESRHGSLLFPFMVGLYTVCHVAFFFEFVKEMWTVWRLHLQEGKEESDVEEKLLNSNGEAKKVKQGNGKKSDNKF